MNSKLKNRYKLNENCTIFGCCVEIKSDLNERRLCNIVTDVFVYAVTTTMPFVYFWCVFVLAKKTTFYYVNLFEWYYTFIYPFT